MDSIDLTKKSECGEYISTNKIHQSNVNISTQYANTTSSVDNTSKSKIECHEYEVLQKPTHVQSTKTTEEGIWGRIKKQLIVIIFVIQVILIVAVVTIAVLFSASKTTRQDSFDRNQLKSLDDLTEKMLQMDIKIEKLQKQFEQNVTTGEETLCAEGWIHYLNSCYLFWDTNTLKFYDAAALCVQYGAHLVFVETEAENNFIKQKLRTLPSFFWWMGITDAETDGIWKYYGTDKIVSFTDWKPGEPNNNGGSESCGNFWNAEHDYKWNDYTCNLLFNVICEKHV